VSLFDEQNSCLEGEGKIMANIYSALVLRDIEKLSVIYHEIVPVKSTDARMIVERM
jgi:hypothetical protein